MSINLIGISGKKGVGKDLVADIIPYLKECERVFPKDPTFISYEDFLDYIKAVSSNIVNQSEWENIKFADKLKDIVCLLIGCTREQLEDRGFKEKELGEEWDKFGIRFTHPDGYKNPKLYGGFTTREEAIIFEKNERRSLQWSNDLKTSIERFSLTPRLLLQLLGTECGRQIIHQNIWVNSTFANYTEDSKWIISDVRFPNEAEVIKSKGGILIRVNRPGFEDTGNHESETALDNYKGFDYIVDNDSNIDDLIEKIYNILINKEMI